MIIATLCTIPVRKETFKQVVHSVLHQQTVRADQLHVWLNGYQQIDSDLPQDARLIYHLEPANPGPWIRYKAADDLDDKSVIVTLDDDMLYAVDYLEKGLEWINQFDLKAAICFSGILWDPFQTRFSYGSRRFQYMAEQPLTELRQVALNKGQTSFFPAGIVRQSIDFSLSGFRTNDDMMISYGLQRRQVPIYCCPKPAGWIRETSNSQASHALFRTDTTVRKKTFAEMLSRLGFDPTAGLLKEIKESQKRVLILGETCPPLPGGEEIDQAARRYCASDSSIHILAGTPASLETSVQQYVDIPYLIHPVTHPEPGGRLDNANIVRSWRLWRIRRQKQLNWHKRYQTISSLLEPTQVYRVDQNGPSVASRISENAVPLLFH